MQHEQKLLLIKNHINGLGYADSQIIITPHGFIKSDKRDKSDLDAYKKETSEYWAEILGDGNFDLEEYEVKTAVDTSDDY